MGGEWWFGAETIILQDKNTVLNGGNPGTSSAIDDRTIVYTNIPIETWNVKKTIWKKRLNNWTFLSLSFSFAFRCAGVDTIGSNFTSPLPCCPPSIEHGLLTRRSSTIRLPDLAASASRLDYQSVHSLFWVVVLTWARWGGIGRNKQNQYNHTESQVIQQMHFVPLSNGVDISLFYIQFIVTFVDHVPPFPQWEWTRRCPVLVWYVTKIIVMVHPFYFSSRSQFEMLDVSGKVVPVLVAYE